MRIQDVHVGIDLGLLGKIRAPSMHTKKKGGKVDKKKKNPVKRILYYRLSMVFEGQNQVFYPKH